MPALALRIAIAILGRPSAKTLISTAIAVLIGLPLLTLTAVVSVIGSDREAAARACAHTSNAGAISPGAGLPAGLRPGARARFYEPLQMQPGRWYRTGATRYANAPGDAGAYGSIPDPEQRDLRTHPDTFAELSLAPTNPANTRTFRFQDANALGQLPYMTALQVEHQGRSAVVYKRDVGYGQGTDVTASGERYRIDLWEPVAEQLNVHKDEVRIALAPPSGTGQALGQTPDSTQIDPSLRTTTLLAQCEAGLGPASGQGPLPLTPGQRARLLPNGLAAAPERAPEAVKQVIAAGNALVGKPYLYGGAHGTPLSRLMPAYDCSSSLAYLLYGARLVEELYTPPSGEMATSLGLPGYGRWISVLANNDHVYAYVASLRWDTHNAVPGEQGNPGIGWHTGRRDDITFTPRHPNGL